MIRLKPFLVLVSFATLLIISGCDLTSSDANDSEEFNFDAVIAGESWEGSSTSRVVNRELRIRGDENEDSIDDEFIFFRIAEFEGEGTYPVFNSGYSVVIGGDAVGSFGSAEDTTGTAIITVFNDSLNVVEGAFIFELTASIDFDNVREGERFTISGNFRSQIDTTSN